MHPQNTTVLVERGVSMTLSDGTRLASDIYRPDSAEPLPVLLMRQPYGREIASTVVYAQPEYFARAGFMVVIQDVRGRGDSEGEFYTFRNEAKDGCETIEWAAALDGADGRVCMYGFSYQAYTQLAVLENKPEALVAIAPHMSAADLYNGWFYRNGTLRLASTLSWGNQMLREDAWRRGATESAKALEATYGNIAALAKQFPLAQTDPITRKDIPSYPSDWLEHPQQDSYWDALDTSPALSTADLPVFHLSGYYDYYSQGSLDAYLCRQDTSKDFFLLTPWKHIPWERWLLGLDLGEDIRIDTDKLFVEWLNAKLGRSEDLHTGVRYFVLGENKWRNCPSWPPETEPKVLYLYSQGRANSLFGGGQLIAQPEKLSPSDSFVYDPEVPVLAPGGMIPAHGPIDLKEQQQANNLLVFDTAHFDTHITIAGAILLDVYVKTTAIASAFVARLSWLKPDGSAHFLCLACAETTQGEFARDCTRLKLTFDTTAITIAPGEALRLDIASSAFPLLARHPNTETDPLQVASPHHFKRARQTVFHDTTRPSCLTLPILK